MEIIHNQIIKSQLPRLSSNNFYPVSNKLAVSSIKLLFANNNNLIATAICYVFCEMVSQKTIIYSRTKDSIIFKVKEPNSKDWEFFKFDFNKYRIDENNVLIRKDD